MLRSRSLKEGSLGLLIVAGIAIFGGISLWLRGIQFGQNKYQIIAQFSDVNGIATGDPIRYRGLKIGNIKKIAPQIDGVEVTMEISSSKLLIPQGSTVQAVSAGLIGETFIDIQPPATQLISESSKISPLSKQCADANLILCDGDRLKGETGLTIDDLLPLMYQLNLSLSQNPELFENMGSAAQNASVAAAEIAELTQDVSSLVADVNQELGTFSDAAKAITEVAQNTSETIDSTARQYQDTARQLTQLASNADELITENRTELATTLNNISTTSESLHSLVNQLDQTVAQTDTKQLIQNLETLTANAADTSANLKEISNTFGDPNTLVNLQQTLDSARVTFSNAQKITADLEDITGDPNFRNDIRNLVDGLSNLLSSTEQLEQQMQTSLHKSK
ncbi:ABC-type transport system involved in resistance to organic solvents, periplasmic component [Xenococcus sp. PCC 7305]|uniref:MlaD family protein n=1 Tax=Xenococcus sp. PCC 7305 TaxID=102125 RepID=UPI0002ABF142|nr:MlaD family protein [Xenococcus sp. PCC 7305]ELS00596.1 ABC-type transport system involved in resistance to organic solvents, periplasmic component [Xenococcus sp. PCC 7305]